MQIQKSKKEIFILKEGQEDTEISFMTEKEILDIVKEQCPILIWHKMLHEDNKEN